MSELNKKYKKTSYLAIASLLLTIVFPAGLILAMISIVVIIRNKDRLKGIEWAIAAIVLNIIGIWFYYSTAVPVTEARSEREKVYTIRYNLRLVGDAVIDYANNNNGYLPQSDNWFDVILEHNKKLTRENFQHPSFNGYVIAFNRHLSGRRLEDIPPKAIMLFEAKGAR